MFGCCAKKKVEARIVEGALVVSLPGADPPRVWRTDMAQANSSIMEIREAQDKFWLVMKAQGREEDIAAFTDKKSAVNALQVVTDAMLDGAKGPSGFLGRLLRRIFKILFWLLLFTVVALLLRATLLKDFYTNLGAVPPVAPVESGVAVPAEDLFGE